jgi:hypothetical protein
MSQPRPLHLHLAVGQFDPAGLRTVPANLAAGLAGRARAGDLFGAQPQNQFQGLDSDFVDDGLDYLAGAFHQVQQGKQDLSIGLAELLDDGRRLFGGLRHDLVCFTHGGWLLRIQCFG